MNREVMRVGRHELSTVCENLLQQDWELLTMVASDERDLPASAFVIRYFFAQNNLMKVIESSVPAAEPTYASVTRVTPAAAWYEREAFDLFGLYPIGHPDLRPLVLHEDWPQDVYPLRKDYPLHVAQPRVQGRDWDYPKVAGAGVFEVPVGPIHAGVIEPGHFRFQVMGDSVLHLEAKLFYKHRGLEKRAEGISLLQGRFLAERTCAVCSVSHALSYAHAVEQISATEVPTRARFLRSLFAELERLYNHIGDIGNLCAGIGFAYGSNHGARLKEQLMQLNDSLTGHRYLRGTIVPGGVARDLTEPHRRQLELELQDVKQQLHEIVEVIVHQDTVRNRFVNTGILSSQAARRLAAVGPAARASGIRTDARLHSPYDAYSELDFEIPTLFEGDVMARFQIRVLEVEQSFRIIEQILAALPAGLLQQALGDIPAFEYGIGITESARGANAHYVMSGKNGVIFRYRVRSASYANWPVVPQTVPGNIIADFPLINKSFELCYACCDR